MAKNTRSEYRTWPMILEQVRSGRPVKTAEEAWVIQACKSLPARTRNALAKLGIQFSGDLQYVTGVELCRQGGISSGALSGLHSMCTAWGVTLGSKAAPGVTWASTANLATESEAVNHPSHYHPGPYEVYKVLDHFQVFHPKLWNALTYLARVHAKGREQQDRAKAAWYLENFLSTGAGFDQPSSYMQDMAGKSVFEIARDQWGCDVPTAEIIDKIMTPYTLLGVGEDGDTVGNHAPDIFQAWRMLTAEVGR